MKVVLNQVERKGSKKEIAKQLQLRPFCFSLFMANNMKILSYLYNVVFILIYYLTCITQIHTHTHTYTRK